MKNKVLKAVMVIFLIITLTIADFILLGTELITYASQNIDDATNNNNVKFSAYFKAEEKEVSQIDYKIDNAEMKLYLKVAVEKEGYFDGVITIENANFKIKQNSTSEVIKNIEGNTITLNQINAGNTETIELGIEPIIEESYKATMLNKKSSIKLTGNYKDSEEKLISIKAEKNVTLNLLVPTNIDTVLTGKIITNRIYKIGEENKKIVQLELNSNVLENSYPVEQTIFELSVPKEIETIEVITKGTYATNGEADRNLKNNYEYNAENRTISITIKNQNKDGKISWNKNATDNIIVTLILSENAETNNEEYNVKASVKLYGKEERTIEKTLQYNLSEEKDGLIRASIQNDEEIYKGKIYSGEERPYNSTTNIEINYANLIETSTITETTTYRVDKETADKASNIHYKSTTIKKSEILTILGESGVLTIKGENGEALATINKDTEADASGNITITYPEGVKTLEIELTKAVQTGIIRLNHEKVIKAENYTREEIKTFNYLIEKAEVSYNTAKYEFEKIKTLGETQTVAELAIEPKTLSTATVNEAVKIAVTLRTDNEKYDLYKNPTITIKLPDYIKSINVTKTTPLYLENMKISKFEYVSATKEIKLQIQGEQTQYNSINTNIYIEILANIELEETTPNKKDEITLTYTNQKAVTYLNEGKCVVPVNISGYSGLVGFNSITNYGIQSVSAGESTEQIGNLKMYQNATEANFKITLINNTGTNLENIKILGNLPVDGETTIGNYKFTNTVGATLKSAINLEEGVATIYYTENRDATKDLQNIENGWNSNLSALTNPVLYMLVINQMSAGMQVKANYTMNIPANVDYNKDMRTTYIAEYASNVSSMIINAKPVGLETGKVMVTLEANVGTDKLENGATVKAGEVIKYKVTVENTGSNVANNVKITGIVPEGTVYVEPIEEYYQNTEIYYDEIQKDSIEKNIEALSSKEKQTFEYEVRVENDIKIDSIKNQVTVVYGDGIEVKSNEMSNQLASANVRVTVKRMANVENLLPGNIGKYYVIVENITNVEQKNLKVKFNMPSSEIATLQHIEELNTKALETNCEWNIDSIQAGKCKVYSLFVKVNQFTTQSVDADLSAVVTQENNTYRSNVYNETLYGIDIEIKMTSPNEGEYLKTDDVIEYNIEIKNKSEQQISVTFTDNIPQQLSITKIEITGVETKENILDNYIYKTLTIEANETIKIKISTIVNYDRFRLENITITNIAKLLYINEELVATEEISHIIESIVIKEEPEEPTVDPEEPSENPETPNNPDNPENPDVKPEKSKYNISGKVWVDQDKDGELNNKDNFLKDINVKLLNVETNEFVRNTENNKDLIVKTNEEGYYEFEQIPEGKYIVVFEYDKDLYKPTIYEKEGIEEAKNSNVVSKTIEINGTQKEYATTNTIELKQNTSDINMGLVFIKQFDIKLDKYISKIQVQTSKGITTYDYQNAKLAKVEVNAKRIVGSTILVQYTIKATNIGDVDAYITSIADYIPAGLKFSSELNTDWYNLNENLYTNALQNTAIAPGESKEIKLTLIKNKTDGDAELINNMAEIQEAYNIYGISDTNSTEANMNKDENDLGSADLIIGIQTGTTFNYIALVISMLGVIGVAAYLINRKIMRIKF